MLRVVDLTDSNFPQEFLDVLPVKCVCGANNEITESLTILFCPNKRCIEKAVQRLVAMLKDLGVKNMGEAKCRKFLEHWGLVNPYAIFMYEPSDGVLFTGASKDFSEEIYTQINDKRSMLLWEYIKVGNLSGIRDSARYLAADYNSLEDFYDDVEAGGIARVQDLLSIKKRPSNSAVSFEDEEDNSVSVKAVDVYDTLMSFKEDLLSAVEFVKIIEVNTQMLNICISTAVGAPYESKTDFVTQMNNRYGSKVHLNFLSAVTKDTNFLIWSKQGSPTSKVEKANKYGVEVLTGAEFEKYLKSL